MIRGHTHKRTHAHRHTHTIPLTHARTDACTRTRTRVHQQASNRRKQCSLTSPWVAASNANAALRPGALFGLGWGTAGALTPSGRRANGITDGSEHVKRHPPPGRTFRGES
uniref:Uncharacterized protein n=1 Tax=Eutreptiella gymnastica TaxID=73025 RepID=A0A7S1IFF7_9EUGL